MSKLISKIVVPDSSEATGYALYNVKDANAIPASEKGVASGVATLDSSGKVPSSQLPSYVDDVIEGYYHDNKFYATYTPGEEEQEGTYSDEITPEQGKIYVDIPTNQSYRWSGSTYIVISSPYVLPTASANTLGGVKVGDGLSIDNNGVLSAEGQEVEIGTTSPVNDVKLFVDEDGDPTYDVYTKAETDDLLDEITDLIPAQATTSNQLADKDFVNSSVSTATATYRGCYNLVSDLSLTTQASHGQIETALATAVSGTPDNNDYAFVQIPTDDTTPTEIASVERYKFNGTLWSFEYTLNNSGFTAAQWAAVNSNITSGLVTKLNALSTNGQSTVANLFGMDANGNFQNISAANLASVLGAEVLSNINGYPFAVGITTNSEELIDTKGFNIRINRATGEIRMGYHNNTGGISDRLILSQPYQ